MRRCLIALLLAMYACADARAADAVPVVNDTAQSATSLSAKWRSVQLRIAQDAARLAACRADPEACSIADVKLEAIADSGRAREGRARLGEINRAVNLTITPASDVRRFGIADLWSSPLETMQAGVGDCEDYAILKFLALREAGVPAGDLQFLIVHDAATGTDHAVLAAWQDGRWLILDNRGFALPDLSFVLQLQRYRLLATLVPDDGMPNLASAATPAPGLM